MLFFNKICLIVSWNIIVYIGGSKQLSEQETNSNGSHFDHSPQNKKLKLKIKLNQTLHEFITQSKIKQNYNKNRMVQSNQNMPFTQT